nr:TlpA disulfide reductase family protein [Haloarchaeobius amylolyticus]
MAGGGLWVAQHGLPGGSDGASLPVRVETLDAPGSSAGEALVPTPGTVTVVDLFATWCAPCKKQLDVLNAVRGEYDDVSFVSVTNERVGDSFTRADIADWWRRHDGHWTVGLEPGGEILKAFGATGLPHVAIADSDGRLVFEHGGLLEAATLRSQLAEVV